MPKRKAADGDDLDSDQTVPLPIQTFLWRQTNPFIRPKQSKLVDASCVSFERVLVQNILHGLSPSLCESIQSISRWKLIQASFPHLIHCCSTLLNNRKVNRVEGKFDSNETKLLYTIHWLILDAASECEDMDLERTGGVGLPTSYMFKLDSIQLFVYLMAPLIESLNEAEFQTLKLENGLRLWQPLWEYRQPDVTCFSSFVKPKRNTLKASRHAVRVNFNTANIYIGKGTSTDNIYLGFDDGIGDGPSSRCSINTSSGSPLAPLCRMSDICHLSTTTDTQSTSIEIVCEVCNQVTSNRNGESACQCGTRRASYSSVNEQSAAASGAHDSPIDKDYVAKQLESAITSGFSPPAQDMLSASYFDVAVLRCLFIRQWGEEGVYWALRYMHQRLLEVCDEMHRVEYHRERSQSLPNPQLPPSPPPFCPAPSSPSPASSPKKEATQPEVLPTHEPRKEPSFKRMRVTELKNIFDSKVKQLRRRESQEQFDVEVPSTHTSHHRDEAHTNGHDARAAADHSNSMLAKLRENEEDSYGDEASSGDSSSDNTLRKSLPISRNSTGKDENEDDDDDDSSGGHHSFRQKRASSRSGGIGNLLSVKPIITITQDSPQLSPNMPHTSAAHVSWMKRPSLISQNSQKSSGSQQTPANTANLQRSMTDSNISYHQANTIEEVPGSVFYIQKNGELNYNVVLQATRAVANRECSARICGVLLNIINCLLDLGVIEQKQKKTENTDKSAPLKKEEPPKFEKPTKTEKTTEDEKKEKPEEKRTAHHVAMETVVRIFRIIGCPHGCGDGYRGTMGDHLRVQGINCLTRLQQIHTQYFRNFLKNALIKLPLQDIVDFLHALLGFCIDPLAIPISPQPTSGKKEGGKTGYANNFGEPLRGGHSVDGQIIYLLLKPLVTRFVQSRKDLQGHENIGLYCDVRQLMNFVKETCGGTFRLVALSGLMDAIERNPKKKDKPKKTKIVRRTWSMTSAESGDERNRGATETDDSNAKSRRSIFRRKTKKQITIPQHGTVSDSEVLEEPQGPGKLSPRVSMSATEDDPPSGSSTPKRKFSKFNIAWKRSNKSDHEGDDSANEAPVTEPKHEKSKDVAPAAPSTGPAPAPRPAQSSPQPAAPRTKAKMSFKAASQATLSFLSARKRIEDGLKNWNKRRLSKRDSVDEEGNRRGSVDVNSGHATEVIIIRERRLVSSYAVKSGMLRFNFMLDCCQPGSVPDPHLIAALLDLEAPVVARAALLLECAHFVNRCNHGDWPNWMKLNLPGFRQAGLLNSRGQPSGYRRNILLQRTAGHLFHQWGEAIANRLYDLLREETPDKFMVIHQVRDDNKKRELRIEDEEEDFLDEASVNHTGSDCPYALKMIACQVLLEITTFLRETYQYIPKTKMPKKDLGWEKSVSSRRWSSVLSSPGHSERSNSRSSQGDLAHSTANVGSPSDRKISFAVFGQMERSDSLGSSTTSVSMAEAFDSKGRRINVPGKKLLKMRRGSGHNASFGNRSFKLKRGEGGSMRRLGSIKSRKVSMQSLKSDRSDEEHSGEADSAGMMSDGDNQESPDDADETDYSKCMPWIKVVVQLANTSNFICDHQSFCHPNCYERQRRSCTRLMTAIRKIYESKPGDVVVKDEKPEETHRDNLRDKLKRRESMFQPSSPTRRRESTPLLQKINVADVNLVRAKVMAALEKKDEPKKKEKKVIEELPVQKYIRMQVQNLTQSPMSIISKAAPILSEDSFIDMLPVAWELILENDQELAASAATVFILSSVKAPEQVQEMMFRELQHDDVNQRIHAILRFGVLWRFRYQVWPRMEDGANMYFKVPPPSIDFVLPSPTIGMPLLPVIDPPWMPHFKTKVEEVTINQEESKTFVTATTTRRKQQQEMIHRALLAEEDRRRAAREGFLMTAVPITQQSAYEPALHHASEEHEEAMQEEINLAARRMSVAPINRASNLQQRNLSWRQNSMFWPRPNFQPGEEERIEHVHHMQLAQHFFPSCICAAALPIIHLLEDLEVNTEGVSVSEVACKVVWHCMVEEPTLFLRTFLEKLTNKERKDELIYLLRKLLYYMPALPAQTAHTLFNYLIGFVMFYVRSPVEGGNESIGQALSILWQVVPSVNGIFFKDLKQTLRKEQCDPTLMVTANVPSAKKLIVHGPDQTSIPSQYPIHEDTQFESILQDSLDFFNIPEDEQNSYFLVDTKTNQMHNLNSYVRDFYFFRRNFYPQLSLVCLNQEEASKMLQKQALTLKFVEMGKVLFSMSIVEGAPANQVQNHISFLHEELQKLPSFPRKALEAEFGLYKGHDGKELYGADMLHKYSWTKLMAILFKAMSSTFTLAGDLPLFLNVVSGTLLLHCEDTAMLRKCLSTFINASKHFKQVFSTSGFTYIMPSLMKVYSNHQSNLVLASAIEFTCRQFYTLHRKPFIMQMFGSIAPILNMNEDPRIFDYTKVDPRALFNLLLALENDCPDNLDILELVDGDKPLTALDFCYHDDPDVFNLIDSINMCVTVMAYACDSVRAMQMLTIMEALLPYYLNYLKNQTTKADSAAVAREEITIIGNIAVSIRALIISSEPLARNFSGPQRTLESVNSNMKSTANHSNHSPQGPTIYYDEQSEICYRYMEEGTRGRRHPQTVEDKTEITLSEFRRPRNSLLCIAAYFFSHCSNRIREIRKLLSDASFRMPELLDHKSHNRLADIAHTVLKVAPYDPATMGSPGLQRYVLDILPITDWSQESIRPALNLIFRRLERCFSKIYKKGTLRKNLDWDAASNMLKGVYNTLAKYTYIAHLPHLKTLINVCLNILLADETGLAGGEMLHAYSRTEAPLRVTAPPLFCYSVIKLTAMQMQALGDQYTLEHLCGGMTVFPTPEKTINILVNLVLPLSIRMGCGRRDCPRMRMVDINFALTVLLHALAPPKKQMPSSGSSTKVTLPDIGRSASVRSAHQNKIQAVPKENLLNVVFLGLKVMIVCFDKQLCTEWHRIARSVQDIGGRLLGGIPLWQFLDFVVTTRAPLFMLLQPFIQYRMMKVMCETEQEYFLQHLVHQKLQGHNMPHARCKGSILAELTAQLRTLKEELFVTPVQDRSRSPTVNAEAELPPQRRHSVMVRASSVCDILEQLMASKVSPTPATSKFNKDSCSSLESATEFFTKAMTPEFYMLCPLSPSMTYMSSSDSSVSSMTSMSIPIPLVEHRQSVSPALVRKSTQRIRAQEGSRLLEKYLQKHHAPEEESAAEASFLRATSPRKLQRQASIYQRPHITKQQPVCGTPPDESNLDDLQPDGTDDDYTAECVSASSTLALPSYHQPLLAVPCSRSTPLITATKPLQRRARVMHHGFLRQLSSDGEVARSMPDFRDLTPSVTCACPQFDGQPDQQDSSSPTKLSPVGGSPDPSQFATPSDPSIDCDPRMHRLQRQDAKSRKTFKIKRHRSTIKGNIIRSATVKPNLKTNVQALFSANVTPPAERLERLETQQEEPSDGDGVIPEETNGERSKSPLPPSSASSSAAAAPPPEGAEAKPPTAASRKRFIPRSKSHDDGGQHHYHRATSSGTARGRIARQGAYGPRSRSPSTSPSRRYTSPNISPSQSQTYVNKCDSVESLSNEENLALLKEEEKTKSHSSLLIFFDGSEMQDTCV